MRSTVLRLERRIQQDHADAVVAMEAAYAEIAGAAVQAARDCGYLGSDPLGAIAHLATPATDLGGIAPIIIDLWQVFFASFRSDEAQFEAARFRQDAADLNARVEALATGEQPDSDLLRALLDTLIVFWEERTQSVSERLDHLIADLNSHQAALGSTSLAAAHHEDLITRATGLVATALVEWGDQVPTDLDLAQLMARLIDRWRNEHATVRRVAQDTKQQHQAFLQALEQAAMAGRRPLSEADQDGQNDGDDPGPRLSSSARKVVREVADLVETGRLLEKDAARLQARVVELERSEQTLRQEMVNRDAMLARYELQAHARDDDDQRLDLYRQAVRALSAGRDASGLLDKIQELERVLVTSRSQQEQAHTLLDRRMDECVSNLLLLRRCVPLIDDPRRFRPRLLKSSPYRLKTLSGLIQALRDASRDVQLYADRARWVYGVQVLTRSFGALRKIFAEMVRLVADCRERAGGAPPLSLSISMDQSSGVASLPRYLALDVQSLARRRSASRYLHHILPLFEECLERFHAVVEKASGETVERPAANKRESAPRACARLADELLGLDGMMNTLFAEAGSQGWQMSREDQTLAESEPVIGMALEAIDGACDVLAVIDGSPATDFTRVPRGKRLNSQLLLTCARERVAWLEDIATYRIEVDDRI